MAGPDLPGGSRARRPSWKLSGSDPAGYLLHRLPPCEAVCVVEVVAQNQRGSAHVVVFGDVASPSISIADGLDLETAGRLQDRPLPLCDLIDGVEIT